MTTESPIRMLESRVGVAPARSGSAPPTVDGSIAALRSFMTNSRTDFPGCDSEELMMRSDPSYIAYYHSHVNLNPRLPPPIISQENRHLLRIIRDAAGVKKISVADGLLATHNEEPEEDSSSPQNAALDNNSTALDLTKGAPPGFTKHDSVTTAFSATVSSCSKNADDLGNKVSSRSSIQPETSVMESRMQSLDVSAGSVTEDNQKRLENLLIHEQNRRFQAIALQTHAIHQGATFGVSYPKLQGMQPVLHSTPPGFVPPLYATTSAYMNPANLVHPSLLPAAFPNPHPHPQPPPLGGYIHDAHPLQMSFVKAPMEPVSGEIHPHRSQMMYSSKPHMQNAFVLRPFMSTLQGRYIQHEAVQSAVQQKDADVHSHPARGNLSISSSVNGVNYYGYPPGSYYGYPPGIVVPQFPAPPPAVLGSPMSDLIASEHYCKGQRGSENSDDCRRNSFLELLKSSNSRKLELSDISGQIVEFSTDQHGSRFIQQKLEHCSTEEKNSVFKEVFPHASKLMTDVFGNYVIQKFFDHGTLEHRRQLGEQLTGQVLNLSLQMYGCRVIQKALEVIELDQKVALVQELDGHVTRCIHDQNGNHVIQKCIESIPADKISFIISSFYGQVSALSSHPYGCRVIQRVLEHCSDEQINEAIVGEILESTYSLAQDPYGNYVTQHILEMGKPRERSQIIQKLAGKFRQMSQLKFASNVVEKCLKYGDDSERNLIIEEFISGSDSLLMLMKDQFANYVVQKLFDIGTEKQKEAFLDCIKSHLPELKRFSYAKQIVARYELLLTEAEGSSTHDLGDPPAS